MTKGAASPCALPCAPLCALLCTLLLAGCASPPTDLESTPVSPELYADYNCEQLAGDAERINNRLGSLYARLKEKADDDAWQAGVGVVFLPMLLALEFGDGRDAEEYSQRKGEYDAIKKAATAKKCPANTIPAFKNPEIHRE